MRTITITLRFALQHGPGPVIKIYLYYRGQSPKTRDKHFKLCICVYCLYSIYLLTRKIVSNTDKHLRRLAKLALSSTSFLLKVHTQRIFPEVEIRFKKFLPARFISDEIEKLFGGFNTDQMGIIF